MNTKDRRPHHLILTSFKRVVTDTMLKEKFNSYGEKAKCLIATHNQTSTSSATHRDILILMKDNTTVWLTSNLFGKEAAEIQIKKILAS